MSDNIFDTQALIDLINSVELANGRKQEYFYFCYSEPSDEVKVILKDFGLKYKVIPNKFMFDLNVDENTAFIIPKCESYIKLEFD
jgi:hypothetical protein